VEKKREEKSGYVVSRFERDRDFPTSSSECELREDDIEIIDNVKGATFRMELRFTSHFPWVIPSLEFKGRSTERAFKKETKKGKSMIL